MRIWLFHLSYLSPQALAFHLLLSSKSEPLPGLFQKTQSLLGTIARSWKELSAKSHCKFRFLAKNSTIFVGFVIFLNNPRKHIVLCCNCSIFVQLIQTPLYPSYVALTYMLCLQYIVLQELTEVAAMGPMYCSTVFKNFYPSFSARSAIISFRIIIF